ncbi:hypothetical protein H1P_4590004 [Hyella patelloides LEGE 07179]|uniref:Uncharacterized protein n=1 Tax=Hyella patelloides LEGE 07179 TaxID=945734 RepID=A0A563VYG8_9CYAN|nr:hypothetical protein [Hyella patelloides]VEP16502.1 hypothetical protein H1P_4590004 [Hyella patelloides LEGE 07179]
MSAIDIKAERFQASREAIQESRSIKVGYRVMAESLPVLSFVLVTGEGIEPAGLPVLRVYKSESNQYIILEGENEIENALNESFQHLEEAHSTVRFFAVDVIPTGQRTRSRSVRRGGVA